MAIKRSFILSSGLGISANDLYIVGSTASTNSTTGALIVTGGVGIGQSISVGGRLQMFNGANYTAFVSSASGNTVYTLPATSPATGSSVLQSTSAGVMSWVPMTASASSGTTSLNVNVTVAGSSSAPHYLAFTTASTTVAGAALSSGTALTYNPNTSTLYATNINATTAFTGNLTGIATTATNVNVVLASTSTSHPLLFTPTSGSASGIAVSSNSTLVYNPSTDILTISGLAVTSSTNSSSSSTGALIVTGGVGIGGTLTIGSDLRSPSFVTRKLTTVTLGATINNYVEFLTITGGLNGGYNLLISINNNLAGTNIQTNKIYAISGNYGSSPDWKVVSPISEQASNSQSGAWELLIQELQGDLVFRLRNKIGFVGTSTNSISIYNLDGNNLLTFTQSNTTGTDATAYTLSGGSPLMIIGANTQAGQGQVAIATPYAYSSTTALTVSGSAAITGSTASTSTTTGALIVTGGVGIGQSVSVGGRLQMFNSSNYTAFVSSASGNTVYTLPATSPATGSSVLQSTSAGVMSWVPMVAGSSTPAGTSDGVVQFKSSSSLGGTLSLFFDPLLLGLRVSGFPGGETPTSTSAALKLESTVGSFNGSVNGTYYAANAPTGFAGDLMNLQINSVSKFRIDNTGAIIQNIGTNATSTTSGSVQVRGGLGITGALFTGESINSTATTNSTSTTSGSLIVSGGAGIAGTINVGGTAKIFSSSASTNTWTGALLVGGGVGISGQLTFTQASLGFTGITTNPSMSFIGATSSSPITLTVLTDNSLNWEGSQGSVFSIDSNLSTGEIFSVSDISGLPIISASAGQTVNINEFGGYTRFGNGSISSTGASNANADGALVVYGGIGITGNANIGGTVRITNTTVSSSSSSGALVISGGVGIAGTLNIGADLSISGLTTLTYTSEKLNTKTSAGSAGTVTHDLSTGSIFYHSSISNNFTANITNVPTTNDRAIGVTLVLAQGVTAYMSTALQIDGSAQTIKWVNNSTPAGTASKVDIVGFSLIRTGSAWTVLGQYSTYG